MNRLVLRAGSVADDIGYVALADLSQILSQKEDLSYRVIGGHMVTALVARWGLGAELYRETGDTDLGVPPIVVKDRSLIERLRGVGYEPIAGNRFARPVIDIPITLTAPEESTPQAMIDVLVPAYTSRPRQDRRVTDQLVTTEVLGLPTALMRPPVRLRLELHRLNGTRLSVEIAFPDEVAALVLKGFACRVRNQGTDIIDVWRCLEVGLAAGVSPADFTEGAPAEAAAIVRDLFRRRDGRGMTTLIGEQRLAPGAADARFTRIRALIDRILG
ncbi:MAG TPA: hypothetical protein VFA11_03380 [Acidimicrobiales bacterium]|nr:hypothetical protein [Acidimicrobiales bacterium]